MTVTLDLKPEFEDAARAVAQARGISLEDYLLIQLEEMMTAHQLPTAQEIAEFEADLDAFAEGSENLPVLPLEANKRAYYYEE